MKPAVRWMRVLARGALLAASVSVAACRAPHAREQTVRMLLVNDVYVTDTSLDGRGGLARVAALRDSLERAGGDTVLFVLAGDVLSPSVLSKWYGGAQMVEGFNAARLTLATLGNHEFDGSRSNLVSRLRESRFQWLSANCGEANGTPFPGVRGWDTVRVGGVKVGIFGTTVVREYSPYVGCRNPDTATTAAVDTLRREGAELVVALTHRSMSADMATLEGEPRITAILGGHDHDGRRAVRDGRLLVKAVSNARTAILVTFTREGPSPWRATDRRFDIGAGMRDDSATLAVVQRWRDTLTRRVGPDRVLGRSSAPLVATDSSSRRESAFGNLIADALRNGTQADVGLITSGALFLFDDIIPAGAITRHTIEGAFLFTDEARVVTFPLNGARLRELLEVSVGRSGLGYGPYLQLSGVRFRFNAALPTGARIVGDLSRDDGRRIAATDVLQVSMIVYPACRGGEGYHIPEAEPACRAHSADPGSRPRAADLVVQHLEHMNGRVVPPPIGRVTRLDRQ